MIEITLAVLFTALIGAGFGYSIAIRQMQNMIKSGELVTREALRAASRRRERL